MYLFLFLFLFFFVCFLFRIGKRGTYDRTNYSGTIAGVKGRAPRVVSRESRLERETRAALEEIFGVPFKKRRPDFLENPVTGFNLEIDCFNRDLKLGVEANGRQHYHFIPFFHGTPEKFKLQQYKDELKRRMCKENGIELIEIPYNVKNIKSFLIEKISKIPRLNEMLSK